jgi:hypothetical protein
MQIFCRGWSVSIGKEMTDAFYRVWQCADPIFGRDIAQQSRNFVNAYRLIQNSTPPHLETRQIESIALHIIFLAETASYSHKISRNYMYLFSD